VRNPTPSESNEFSTDYSTTTTTTTTLSATTTKSKNNKNKEQIEFAKNLEKERRRLARLLRVMPNTGTENDMGMPSGNSDF